jgi:hypothetical protein
MYIIWRFPKSWGVPQNHPTFDHFSIETTIVLLGIHGLKTRHHPPYPRRSRQGTLMQDPLRSQDGSHSSGALELVWEPQGIRFAPMDNHSLGSCELDQWTSLGGFFQWEDSVFSWARGFSPQERDLGRTQARLDCKDVSESQPDFRWGPQALHPFRKRYTILGSKHLITFGNLEIGSILSWWKSVDPARPSGCTTHIVFTFQSWCQAVAKDGEVWAKQHAGGEIPMTHNQSECHSFMVLRDPRLYYTFFHMFFCKPIFWYQHVKHIYCLSFLHVPPLVFNALAKKTTGFSFHMFSPIDKLLPTPQL